MFKKMFIVILVGVILLSQVDIVKAQEIEMLTEENSTMVHGNIVKKSKYKVYVKCNSNQQYKKDLKYEGHIYTLKNVPKGWYKKPK